LLIINGLVLKNFTVSLQVYNFVRPRALSREENCIVSGKIKLYTFLLIINGLVGILSESRIKGISQITRKLYTLRKNKIVHVLLIINGLVLDNPDFCLLPFLFIEVSDSILHLRYLLHSKAMADEGYKFRHKGKMNS